jgi:hypothetical protein
MSEIRARFDARMGEIAAALAEQKIEPQLETWLEAHYPADGDWFRDVADLIREGDTEGWICGREANGVRFSRPVKPGGAAGDFSVDVVDMDSVVGPHHAHPNGEIDLVLPIDPHAQFDGVGAGWKVYGPGTAHAPTVTGGRAYVLYLLPSGAIDFT